MPNFLDLSLELRDMIYHSVAFLPQQNIFEELRNGKWEERKPLTDFDFKYSPNDGRNVHYSRMAVEPIGPNNLTLRSLSKVNCQLRSGRKISHDLDVALINNETLLPAWVSVPALDIYLDKLNVAIHPISFPQSGCGRGSSGNDSSLLWSFYGILERFLSYGPRGPFGGGWRDRETSRNHRIEVCKFHVQTKILVKTLEIDIVTPKPEFAMLPSNNVPDAHQKGLAMSESVLKNFQTFFDTLLPMEIVRKGSGWNVRTDKGRYGHVGNYEGLASILMYEHIGTIRLLHDGWFKQEWDLSKLLRALELSSLFLHKSRDLRDLTVEENPDKYFEYWHFEVQEYRDRFARRLS